MRIDHHVHTSWFSPDSILDPFVLVRRAKVVGLDAVVVTEHDVQWSEEDLEEVRAVADGLVILSGVEVSAREGHFLVYGLPDLEGVEPGISLKDLLAVVEAHQAAIVAAHPYRWGQDFDRIVADHGPAFHALELVSKNVTRETRARTEAIARRDGLATSGSSDSHEVDTLGCYHSVVDAPIRSIGDFVTALRERKVRPRHTEGAHLACGPVG